MSKVCEYYFAPQSPWSYLGHAQLVALAERYDVRIDLKPMDLGKVFSVSGGLPLAKRWSAYRQLSLNLQPKFGPTSGDASAKLILATKIAHGTNAALKLTEAIMRAFWAEEKNIADAGTLIELVDAAGHDGNALFKSSETVAVQNEYEQFTNEAIAASVFGSPWYIVDGESFWGQDRLDFVERAFQK